MPERTALQFFVGSRAQTVTFGQYQIDIHFDPPCRVTIEYALQYVSPDGTREALDIKKGFGPTALHRIIDKLVTRLEREPLSLTLHMEDGQSLTIFSKLGQYESGQIGGAGSLMIF